MIFTSGRHGAEQHRILLEASIPDCQVDARQILVDDPTRADVEVANLGVALLAFR
jgi:hypothetical protein